MSKTGKFQSSGNKCIILCACVCVCVQEAIVLMEYTQRVHVLVTPCTDMNEALRNVLVSTRFSDTVPEVEREWTVPVHSLPALDRERLELVDNTISQ